MHFPLQVLLRGSLLPGGKHLPQPGCQIEVLTIQLQSAQGLLMQMGEAREQALQTSGFHIHPIHNLA